MRKKSKKQELKDGYFKWVRRKTADYTFMIDFYKEKVKQLLKEKL